MTEYKNVFEEIILQNLSNRQKLSTKFIKGSANVLFSWKGPHDELGEKRINGESVISVPR